MIKKWIIMAVCLCPSLFAKSIMDDKINVITGENQEVAADLFLPGPFPLSIQRSFTNGTAPLWKFNHPNVFQNNPALYDGMLTAKSLFLYTYDHQRRLSSVVATDPQGIATYHRVSLSYKESPIAPKCFIHSTHNGSWTYHFKSAGVLAHAPPYVLEKVEGPGGQVYSYQYCNNKKGKLISNKVFPNGNFLATEYDDKGRVIRQTAPLGNSLFPILKYQFEYSEGATEVRNALGARAVYTHDHDHITSVTHYKGSSVYSSQKFYWDNSVKPARLISEASFNEQGQCEKCLVFAYDGHGNKIKETLYGNLSGLQTGVAIHLKENGLPEGQLESYSISYAYSDQEPYRLISKIEQNGTITHFKYDARGLLQAKFVFDGDKIILRYFYFYDARNLLTKTVIDDGTDENYEHLTGVTERHFHQYSLRHQEPAVGMAEKIVESYLDLATGAEKVLKTTHIEYSESGYPSRQTIYNAQGEFCYSNSYSYDAMGRMIQSSDDRGNISSRSYDLVGNLIHFDQNSIQDGIKDITYQYDFSNRMTKTVEKRAGNMQSTHYQYDYCGNVTATVDPSDNPTFFKYDVFGRKVHVKHPEVLNKLEQDYYPTETFEYDVYDNVIEHRNGNGYATITRYNVRNQPIEIIYADGSKQHFEYRLDGSLVKKLARDGTGELYQRDLLLRPIKVTRLNKLGEAVSTVENFYNGFHLVKTVDAMGNSTYYTYGKDGRCKQMEARGADGLVRFVELEYDASGNVIKEKHRCGDAPEDQIVFNKKRTSRGQLIETIIENGAEKLCSVEKETEPSEDLAEYNYHFINSRGQTVVQAISKDLYGNKVYTTLDALKRVESIEKRNKDDLLVSRQEMRYDGNGNKILEIHDVIENLQVVRTYTLGWEYDCHNKIVASFEKNGSDEMRLTQYLYNKEGQLTTLIHPNGTSLSYTYDNLGRLASLSDSTQNFHYLYTYDNNDRVIQVEDLIQKTISKRTFDSFGKVISETLANNLTLEKKFDALGRCIQITLPDQSQILYRYDGPHLAKVERVSPKNNYSCEYLSRNSSGCVTQMSLAGSLGNIQLQYDNKNRLVKIESPFHSEAVQAFDLNQRIAKLERKDHFGTEVIDYQYDAREQLIEENDRKFGYDSLFNRIKEDDLEYKVNGFNQLVGLEKSQFSYNENGLLVKKVDPSETTDYYYDGLNRLIKVVKGSNTIQYSYDAFNRRISKNVNGMRGIHFFEFLYDENIDIGVLERGKLLELRLIGERDRGDIGSTIAMELAGKAFAPLHDLHGSIVGLVNCANKKLVLSKRFSAFGKVEATEGTIQSSWGFFGKRFDEATGLINFGQRDYDPATGRWMEPDPMGQVDGPNRYAFLLNNPVNSYDLWGHFSVASIWDNFFSDLVRFYNTITNVQIFTNASLEQEMHRTAEQFFGNSFLMITGYYSETLSSDILGKGELSDKVRITALNGVLNLKEHWIGNIEMLSRTHGNVNVHYIYDPSQGWTGDAVKAFLAKCGYVSPAVSALADKWKHLIQEMGGPAGGGLIIHYAHSMGGTNTAIAKDLLTPEEQKMIKVITIGSPTFIPNGGFQQVINYVSHRDFAGLFDPANYFKSLFGVSNVVHIGSYSGLPLVDHLLSMETYARLLEMLGAEFQQNYIMQAAN